MRKLIIADRQWCAYRDAFAAALGATWRVASAPDSGALEAELAGADALLALEIPPGMLSEAAGLKVFLYPGAGVARTDPRDYPAGCAVVNVYEHGTPVAEYVMAAILLHATGMAARAASFRHGSWEGSGRTGGEAHTEVCGKVLGLIGYGVIGGAVAERALAFGMRVLAISAAPKGALPDGGPPPHFLGGPADLPLLLRESDYLTIACPLTPATRGMLGASELASMKPSAYLINVARAEIIEERALFEALRDRRIAGAALDVWYRYPDEGRQLLHGSAFPFHELPHVVATPHMAGWTDSLIRRRIARMVESLRQYERGASLDRLVLIGAGAPHGHGATA